MGAVERKKAIEIIEGLETVVLTSIDEGGYPRAVAMSNIKAEGMKTIWLATSTSSKKVGHYRANNKASLCYSTSDDGITLTGHIEVLEDKKIKEDLWLDWFIRHFPGGPTDPDYCILKFTTKEAVIWVDNVFEGFTLE